MSFISLKSLENTQVQLPVGEDYYEALCHFHDEDNDIYIQRMLVFKHREELITFLGNIENLNTEDYLPAEPGSDSYNDLLTKHSWLAKFIDKFPRDSEGHVMDIYGGDFIPDQAWFVSADGVRTQIQLLTPSDVKEEAEAALEAAGESAEEGAAEEESKEGYFTEKTESDKDDSADSSEDDSDDEDDDKDDDDEEEDEDKEKTKDETPEPSDAEKAATLLKKILSGLK